MQRLRQRQYLLGKGNRESQAEKKGHSLSCRSTIAYGSSCHVELIVENLNGFLICATFPVKTMEIKSHEARILIQRGDGR